MVIAPVLLQALLHDIAQHVSSVCLNSGPNPEPCSVLLLLLLLLLLITTFTSSAACIQQQLLEFREMQHTPGT